MNLPDGIKRTNEGHFVLVEDTHLSRWIEQHGRLDVARDEIMSFAKYIPRGGTVIDAGASLGDHTETYAELVGPGGWVWAFEPHPMTFLALRENFKGEDNVHCYNMALAAKSGKQPFVLHPNIGASYLADLGDVSVDTQMIDNLNFHHLDFVHLDCEGMEVDVISGGANTLHRFKPVMVVEVNHDWLARYGQTETTLKQLLSEIGYTTEELQPSHGPHLAQRDILCLPK